MMLLYDYLLLLNIIIFSIVTILAFIDVGILLGIAQEPLNIRLAIKDLAVGLLAIVIIKDFLSGRSELHLYSLVIIGTILIISMLMIIKIAISNFNKKIEVSKKLKGNIQ